MRTDEKNSNRDIITDTVIRLKTTVTSETLSLTFPELRKLIGREIEIMILISGEIEDSSMPTRAVQNSAHVAGSFVLDEEAVQRLLSNRFK